MLLPGVISHATNIVEHSDTIADRIVRFAELVGQENVVASADCGFSSQATYTPEIHPTIVWAKSRRWPKERAGPPPGSGDQAGAKKPASSAASSSGASSARW